jgi:hypothetical protein
MIRDARQNLLVSAILLTAKKTTGDSDKWEFQTAWHVSAHSRDAYYIYIYTVQNVHQF